MHSCNKLEENGNYLHALLTLWILKTQVVAKAHYQQAIIFHKRNLTLTIINAVASISVLFLANTGWIKNYFEFNPNLGKNISDNAFISSQVLEVLMTIIAHITLLDYNVLTSITALAVVFTTICQFILRWSERTIQHRYAGNEFSNLLRKAERYKGYKHVNMSTVHNLNRDYNHVTKSYPLVSTKVWNARVLLPIRSEISELEYLLRWGKERQKKQTTKIKRAPLSVGGTVLCFFFSFFVLFCLIFLA